MDATTLLNMAIEVAHGVLEGTVNGVDNDVCHKQPGGTAHPIGATYAHIAASEDMFINMFQGKPPLAAGEWAGKTGMSEPVPGPGGDLLGWSNRVQVDLDQTRKYAAAVYENTKKYVASLSGDDLAEEMEIPGFGKHPRAYFLSIISVVHSSNHCGEIAALKGQNGLQGYPF